MIVWLFLFLFYFILFFCFFFSLVHLPHVSSQPTSFSTYAHTHNVSLGNGQTIISHQSEDDRTLADPTEQRHRLPPIRCYICTSLLPTVPTGTYHTSISVAWCRSLVCISHNHHHLLPLPFLPLLLLLLFLILFVPFFAYRRHLYRRRLQPRTLWVDHNHAPPQDTPRINRALHSCILL